MKKGLKEKYAIFYNMKLVMTMVSKIMYALHS